MRGDTEDQERTRLWAECENARKELDDAALREGLARNAHTDARNQLETARKKYDKAREAFLAKVPKGEAVRR